MAVPYTFGTATAAIPLSNLDSNFATTITLGNTAIQLGNTVTTLNNMTFANTTVSSVSTPITPAQGGTGLATLTANNVMLGNGTNNVTFVAPGTSGNVLASNGTTWTSAKISLPAGSVLQVVSTTKTDTFSTASTSYVDVTGLSVSITPSSASSKILVVISLSGGEAAGWGFQLVRGSTAICIGDSGGGSRMQGTGGVSTRDTNGLNNPSANFLDSPATTSATTYKVQMYAPSLTAYLNRSYADLNANYTVRSASTITVMEIAA